MINSALYVTRPTVKSTSSTDGKAKRKVEPAAHLHRTGW